MGPQLQQPLLEQLGQQHPEVLEDEFVRLINEPIDQATLAQLGIGGQAMADMEGGGMAFLTATDLLALTWFQSLRGVLGLLAAAQRVNPQDEHVAAVLRDVRATCEAAGEALRVGAEASSHARTAFASLELLGTAYQALRDQRSEPGGCRGDVGVFVRLVDILRQHQAHRRLAEELEDAAKSAQDRAAELRGELRRTQQEIQNDVAGSHERLGQQKIEDMQDLPCEVKQKIHNRDLKRSRIAKELRTVLCKLHETLQTATGIALL